MSEQKMTHKKIEKCRICHHTKFDVVFDLGDLHSCGYFPGSANSGSPVAPLCMLRCDDCGLVQLQHDYDQNELFRNTYGYRSGLNASMVKHLGALVNSIQSKISLSSGDTVIDIGSNDATLLKSYTIQGLNRVGIDPSIDQFRSYYPPEIKAQADFFSANAFKQVANGSKARVITSIAMFYDLPDPNAFVADIAEVLDKEGIWVFEQSYLPTMLEKQSFDTICHEHLEYYGLKQIITLLKRHNMRVLDVALNDINGGSFQVYACHAESKLVSNNSKIEQLLADEIAMGLDNLTPFEGFRKRVEDIKKTALEFLKGAKKEGKRVHGYGASTKGNTLLQYFGITQDLVEMIADCNDSKWGSYTPGTQIPIVSEETSRSSRPDYYLVLPWHFRGNFIEREKQFIANGGQFVFPLPQFELVGNAS